jgi:hypothetical protein
MFVEHLDCWRQISAILKQLDAGSPCQTEMSPLPLKACAPLPPCFVHFNLAFGLPATRSACYQAHQPHSNRARRRNSA